MSWRLLAVIMLALAMGLVFGGLRVASAADSAAQFSRVSQLASLGQQVTGLVQALENERDETTGVIPAPVPSTAAAALQHWYDATDAAAAKVQALAAGIGGSFPANIQAKVATVRSVITNLGELRDTAQASQSALAVIADYSVPINDMMALNGQIAQGANDSGPHQRRPDAQLAVPGEGPGRPAARDPVQRVHPGAFANAEQQALITAAVRAERRRDGVRRDRHARRAGLLPPRWPGRW